VEVSAGVHAGSCYQEENKDFVQIRTSDLLSTKPENRASLLQVHVSEINVVLSKASKTSRKKYELCLCLRVCGKLTIRMWLHMACPPWRKQCWAFQLRLKAPSETHRRHKRRRPSGATFLSASLHPLAFPITSTHSHVWENSPFQCICFHRPILAR
jgi:hypothetical protein